MQANNNKSSSSKRDTSSINFHIATIHEKLRNIDDNQHPVLRREHIIKTLNSTNPTKPSNIAKSTSSSKPGTRNSSRDKTTTRKNFTTKNNQNKSINNNIPHTLNSIIITPMKCVPGLPGVSKIIQWDPWNKLSQVQDNKETEKKDVNNGSNLATTVRKQKSQHLNESRQQRRPTSKSLRNRKCVRFNMHVKVAHYVDDEILQTTELLKQESDQQERNKDMRKEFPVEQKKMKQNKFSIVSAWHSRKT